MRGMFGTHISMSDSLVITALCMGIVFIVLMIISQLVSLFKYIPSGECTTTKCGSGSSKENTPKVAPAASVSEKRFNPDDITDENMQIAMLVASMDAAEENEGAYIKIRSVREI